MFDDIKDYLGITEKFLYDQTHNLRFENMRHLQSYGFSGLELDNNDPEILSVLASPENVENYHRLIIFDEVFPDLIRSSIFVTAYALFETHLRYLCEGAARRFNLSLFSDFKGSGCLIKARNYLEQIVGVKVPPNSIWQEVSAYNKIRNCIVHCESEISKCSYADFLLSYIAKNPDYLAYEEQPDKMYLRQGFCEEAIKNFELFIIQINGQIELLDNQRPNTGST